MKNVLFIANLDAANRFVCLILNEALRSHGYELLSTHSDDLLGEEDSSVTSELRQKEPVAAVWMWGIPDGEDQALAERMIAALAERMGSKMPIVIVTCDIIDANEFSYLTGSGVTAISVTTRKDETIQGIIDSLKVLLKIHSTQA